MAKFKIGDRVKMISNEEGDPPLGSVGTVLKDSTVPFVDWDDFTGGHDAMFSDGRKSVSSTYEDDLELIAESVPSATVLDELKAVAERHGFEIDSVTIRYTANKS